ncbi:hypothetical protein G6011_10387 [Alternaria panax]|uniref:Uncharacterized protein n=1 Tax=Alternaria panax TaxID=48097 RepID=A0AAD4IBT4_9PLEO|nr:hypothetical protein G6011_10387 [Alternaria panax]
MSTIHERDINGLATLSVIAEADQCHSELSLCLPTSLAFTKRLTWEQTPWISNTLNQKSVNPIGETDAYRIVQYLASHGHDVTQRDVQCALLFGSTYASTPEGHDMSEDMGTCPHLFLIFPHATMVPYLDNQFLKIWHDDIVKPAIDRAWRDSGLTLVHGASLDTPTCVLPPTGVRTQRDAHPASGFLERLRNGKPGVVRDHWPIWTDSRWHLGLEGNHTGNRTRIYHEAWCAMKGMLKDHPQLSSYQDPILLAVARGQIYVNARLSTNDKFKCVAQEWDRLVDSRFVKPASFQVVFETVIGTMPGSTVEDKPVVTTSLRMRKARKLRDWQIARKTKAGMRIEVSV